MSVVAVLVNGAIALLLAPLFDGVVRKVKAIIHSRKGPPITQTYTDILKLLGKEDLRCTPSLVFRFGPAVVLAAFLVVALLTPMGAGVGLPGDMIVWVYFLTLGAAAIVVVGAASGNPFSQAGGAREIMMMLAVEPIVVAALITAAVKSGSLHLDEMAAWNLTHGPTVSLAAAGIALLLALQANLGKLPFDIPEAESEIIEGPFMEISGPNLATVKLALLIRQLVYCFLFVQLFVPWPAVGAWPLAVLIALAKVLVLFVLVAVVEAVSPRLRIDQALGYMARVLFVSLAALAFAAIGV